MTREQKRLWQNAWKEKQKVKGRCHDCWKRQAGEDNGTLTLCGTCRRDKVQREEKRRRARGMVTQAEYTGRLKANAKPKPPKRQVMGAKLAEYLRAKPEDLILRRKRKADTTGRVENLLRLAHLAEVAKQRLERRISL